MAVQKGTTVIWSVDGITTSGTGIVGSGIEQSFSRSVSSAQKEIMGDDASFKGINDLEGLIARIDKPMSKGDIYRIAELNGHGSPYLLRKHWEKVEAFLVKNKNMFSRKDTE